MILGIVVAMTATAQDRLYINNFTIAAGETLEVEINLDNTTMFTAFQADIFLPDGLSIGQDDGDYLFDLTDRKARNHTVSSQLLSSGAVRILVASQTLKEISGNSGAVVTFPLTADASFSGQKTIELRNIVASTPDRVEHNLDNSSCSVTAQGYNPGDENPQPREGDVIYINDFDITPGETKRVEIMMDNETVFTAFQADICLPDGISIEQEDGDYLFDLTDRKARNHTVSSQLLSSGVVRILVASQTLKEISGNSGAVVTFNIIADANATGTKTIELRNIVASTPDRVEHDLVSTSCSVTIGSSTPQPDEKKVTAIITSSVNIPQGMTIRFNVAVKPADATNKQLLWKSSNPAIATVNADGSIELLEQGMVTITAATTDSSGIELRYIINVTEPQEGDINYDLNRDGSVDVTDVMKLANIVMGI